MLILRLLILPVILAVLSIFMGLLYKGVDRKLAAHMQARIGPPIRQPFRDVRKLFIKENIVPENAVPWIYNLAPVLSLTAAVSILLYMPIGGFTVLSGYGDMILILYLLMIPALGMIIGGFASGSPYATVGAQREMVMLMSYEFPFAITVISIVWKLSTTYVLTDAFSLTTLAKYPVWETVGPVGFIGLCILLLTLLIVTPAELSKIPFDAPEAETEIAGGLLAEYSGRNLAMFYLSDAVKTVAMAGIVVALFFPYNISVFFNLPIILSIIIDVLFFLLKVFIIIFFAVTLVRVGFARLKIDQVSYTYFIQLTLLGLTGLVLLVVDTMLPALTGVIK
ncbi:MAG: NADH-quinone oxidoreductase subunit H [Candidatus Thermoplasmatota archaeon]|nr:NADH-quinone oxidoreductase subunit H [Candidatus Thermoplasmatota archaeon]